MEVLNATGNPSVTGICAGDAEITCIPDNADYRYNLYAKLLFQIAAPEEEPAIEWTLRMLFGDDLYRVIPALRSYLVKSMSRCTGDVSLGTICSLVPPGVCKNGMCVSVCDFSPSGCLVFRDTVRRVIQSVQEDRCVGLGGDTDEDNVCQDLDNCPTIANQDQADSDGDGVGDACKCTPRTMGDKDEDGMADCVDSCLLPTKFFGPLVPNLAAETCGCQPVALVGQGQIRKWMGIPGVLGMPHLDALRCPASADAPVDKGPFLLRDVTRQATSAQLPEHLHNGLLGSGPAAALSQELVTKIGDTIVTKPNKLDYANATKKEDQGAIDAQIASQLFYDFLRTVKSGDGGRALVSISDPLTSPLASMISVVNAPARGVTPAYFRFNSGAPFVGYPVPKPDLTGPNYASAALDIVGHEWFHAFITLSTARPGTRNPAIGLCTLRGDDGTCRNKAGIVEEAFGDAVGVSFENLAALGGRIPGRTTPNYTLGEDLGGEILRDLADPRTVIGFPPHVRDILFQTMCRPDRPTEPAALPIQVRACVGPFQKAYHLLVVGGSFPSSQDQAVGGYTTPTVTVAPLSTNIATSTALAARLIFRAAQNQWGTDRKYGHYVGGLIRAAKDLNFSTANMASLMNALRATGLETFRFSVGKIITPAGAGTLSITPDPVFDGDPIRLQATPAAGRTFAGFTLRFSNGETRTVSTNPATIQAETGLRVEARFN